MSIIIKLTKSPRNFCSFKHVIQTCPKRNESFSSTTQQSSKLKTILKASLLGITIGVPVGVLVTTGYSWYADKELAKTHHLIGKEQKIEVLKEKPQVPVSRKVC